MCDVSLRKRNLLVEMCSWAAGRRPLDDTAGVLGALPAAFGARRRYEHLRVRRHAARDGDPDGAERCAGLQTC